MIVIVIVRIAFVVVLVDVVVIVEELAFGIGHRNGESENVMGYRMTVSEGLTKKTSFVATSQGVEFIILFGWWKISVRFGLGVITCSRIRDEGFPDVKLTYLGGLWVMIECGNQITKDNMIKHKGVLS
nr:RNA-directed DNA polymerase, eukaryota, reverse transcriptase zinc-binding domain protein [Tanacetum cinerariifolium]